MTSGVDADVLTSAPSILPAIDAAPLIQHSAASPEWGTPTVIRHFSAVVLASAAFSSYIDLDYASSSYWNRWAWPTGMEPSMFLDGSPGRDVLQGADRIQAASGHGCGAGFCNAPGLGGGAMVQKCWMAMESDHRGGWLRSGVWIGFSLEQFASLQSVSDRNPLSQDISTIVPSRRVRYLVHPVDAIAIAQKKQARRKPDSKEWLALQRAIDRLLARDNDAPVSGDAPPHASYISILWAKDKVIRRLQKEAARKFLLSQDGEQRSPLQRVAVIGEPLS